MEIKNKLTVTRGEGDKGTEGEGSSRNMYKGPMDKDNQGRKKIKCGRWG